MELTNEQLEHLIVRSLDGELTDDEQLALDRELIRNPEARALMDEYRDVDSVCGAAMSTWLDASEPRTSVRADADDQSSRLEVQLEATGNRQQAARRRSGGKSFNRQLEIGNWKSSHRHHYRQWSLLITGAIAAALLAVILPRPAMTPNGNARTNHAPNNGFVEQPFTNPQASVIPHSVTGTPLRNAAWTNPATYRGTGREVIGIMGDDGNIYWIEVERTRTIERGASPLPADKLNQM